jgi:asparagine synthase (glutamine-hydrolysing)
MGCVGFWCDTGILNSNNPALPRPLVAPKAKLAHGIDRSQFRPEIASYPELVVKMTTWSLARSAGMHHCPSRSSSLRQPSIRVQRRYWSVGDIKSIRLGSDQAYADGLRECLDQAVRRQLRSAHPIGCHLTGGLDSSSVATLAARALGARNQRIMAFTQVPREGFNGQVPLGCYADETPYVEAIRNKASNIDVTYIRNNESDDFADLEKIFLALEGPVRNPTNFGWAMAIARAARTQGRRVLLGGFEGNTSISWSGWPQAVDHLRRGRFLTAYQQWRMFYRRSPFSRWTSFRKLFVEPLAPEVLGNWADRRRHPGRISPWHDHAAIRPEFASEMKVDARARAVGHDFLYRSRPDMPWILEPSATGL